MWRPQHEWPCQHTVPPLPLQQELIRLGLDGGEVEMQAVHRQPSEACGWKEGPSARMNGEQRGKRTARPCNATCSEMVGLGWMANLNMANLNE